MHTLQYRTQQCTQQTRNCVSLSLFLRLPSLSPPGKSPRADDGKTKANIERRKTQLAARTERKLALQLSVPRIRQQHAHTPSPRVFTSQAPGTRWQQKPPAGPGPPSQPPHPGAATPKNTTEDRTASTNTQVSPFLFSLFPDFPKSQSHNQTSRTHLRMKARNHV